MNAIRPPAIDSPERTWHMERRSIDVDGMARVIRLVRFGSRWLASVDTEAGPTLGADASPYLATHRALEPLGVELVEAMTLVGPIERE